MATAGTLISDLDSQTSGTDGDIVQKILADMGTPSGGAGGGGGNFMQPQAMPPAPSARIGPIINSPNPNTVSPLAMDSAPATAHIIGGSHPSPADFANMMHGNPYATSMNQQLLNQQQFLQQFQQQNTGGSSWFSVPLSSIFRSMKTPILVAIIFFVFSLPIVNTMVGMYLPRLLRVGGDLTSIGLLVKSLSAGLFFWVVQRVLVPLVAP